VVKREERAVLTIEEAGRLLNVSRPTAYNLAKSGKIPVLKLGRKLMVPKASLDRMLSDVKPACPSPTR
jgi:excisionase family DNA binding protein